MPRPAALYTSPTALFSQLRPHVRLDNSVQGQPPEPVVGLRKFAFDVGGAFTSFPSWNAPLLPISQLAVAGSSWSPACGSSVHLLGNVLPGSAPHDAPRSASQPVEHFSRQRPCPDALSGTASRTTRCSSAAQRPHTPRRLVGSSNWADALEARLHKGRAAPLGLGAVELVCVPRPDPFRIVTVSMNTASRQAWLSRKPFGTGWAVECYFGIDLRLISITGSCVAWAGVPICQVVGPPGGGSASRSRSLLRGCSAVVDGVALIRGRRDVREHFLQHPSEIGPRSLMKICVLPRPRSGRGRMLSCRVSGRVNWLVRMCG